MSSKNDDMNDSENGNTTIILTSKIIFRTVIIFWMLTVQWENDSVEEYRNSGLCYDFWMCYDFFNHLILLF